MFRLLFSGKARKKKLEDRLLSLPTPQERFDFIYKNRFWTSKESVSGTGSTLEATASIRYHLPIIFEKFQIKTFLDAPCGDFHWMRGVLKQHRHIQYIGGDIVEELIRKNNQRYSNDNISFSTLDITSDPLPDADLMLVRDCLFHLSYADINLFLENLSKSNISYILTTSHREGVKNRDIVTGSYRDIHLFSDPFNWPQDSLYTISEDNRDLYLFKCSSIPTHVK